MPSTAIVTAAPGGSIAPQSQLQEAASEYVQAGVAPNTRRAFEGALRGFSSWCASAGVRASPAEVDTVELYLTARAPQLAASTLALHLAALNAAAIAIGAPAPGQHVRIKALMKGIRYRHGRPPVKKRGLQANDLKRIVKRLPGSLVGLRDQAILLVIYAGALRRCELVALSADRHAVIRVEFVAEGMEIHVGHAKGDQEGRGVVLPIPFGREACPVAALRSWIDASGYVAGAIFRPIDRHGRIGQRQLTDRSVARIIKAAAGSIGLDPAQFSGHSPRRGAITNMHRLGASREDLQRHARHKRFETTMIYIEEADRFASSAARNLGL